MFINIIHIKISSLHCLEEVTSILFRAQKINGAQRLSIHFQLRNHFDNHMPQLYRYYCVAVCKWATVVLNDRAWLNISLFSRTFSLAGS